MSFPTTRLRRLRRSPELRRMVQETAVQPHNLMMPLFIVPGSNIAEPINSLPGQFRFSIDRAANKIAEMREFGIESFMLFGIPETKDEVGSSAWSKDGIIQRAVKEIRKRVNDGIICADLCFCEYTSHGHCGVLDGHELDNDKTLLNLQKQALSLAESGIDMLAPSGMIDGSVGALRHALDESGFQLLPIMSYAAKFASGFYGPFRDAVQSAPSFGDRRAYQMNPANKEEALREVALDIEEGADIVMVKPALPFLDIVAAVKESFGLPTAAYHVSGEYAMVKAAARNGWINEEQVMLESLLSIKRAGADIIITYFAEDFARYTNRS